MSAGTCFAVNLKVFSENCSVVTYAEVSIHIILVGSTSLLFSIETLIYTLRTVMCTKSSTYILLSAICQTRKVYFDTLGMVFCIK